MSLVTFARGAASNIRQTAAVVPSSRRLARAMVDPLRDRPRHGVVEFGAGTGVMTNELLRAMPPGSLLLAFEINPSFAGYLRETIADERLEVVPLGAEAAPAVLQARGLQRVDAVVSSLGLGAMEDGALDAIFGPLQSYLHEHCIVTQFQYAYRLRMAGGRLEYFDSGRCLERYFASVRSNRVWLNFPPAVVITCREALRAEMARVA